MKNRFLLGLLVLSAPAFAQTGPEECRVLVAKEWIQMGGTSLWGCFQFADEAATPGERQFAKLGERFLKVEAEQRFLSADGGNTWELVPLEPPAAAFGSLNVLQPSDHRAARSPEPGSRPESVKPPKKKKRKRRRSTYQH